MPSISPTSRPGYVYDSVTDTWIPIGVGPHTHAATDVSGVVKDALIDAKGDLVVGTAADTVTRLAVGTNNQVLMADSAQTSGLKYANEATATLTAKGDVLTATAANTLSRLAVGANNTVLTADSSTATGLKWAAVGLTPNWTLINSSSLSGSATVTISGISGYNSLLVLYYGVSSASASSFVRVRINGDAAANYMGQGINLEANSAYAANNFNVYNFDIGSPDTGFRQFIMSNNASSVGWGYCLLQGCNSSGKKIASWAGGAQAQGGTGQNSTIAGGFWDSSSTVSSISLNSSSGNFDAGSLAVYGTTI